MSSDDNDTQLPQTSRKDARRAVLIGVKLRRQGETWFTSHMTNLSASGFCIESFVTLEIGQPISIMFPGFDSRRATIMWTKGHQAGCQFDTPLHQAILDHLAR